MLHKKHRLAKTKEVKLALAKGRGFFSPFFSVKFIVRPNGLARFTFVVSTKVSKKAVVRNRLKRILRETVRKQIENFVSGDYVVIVKQAAIKKLSQELIAEFNSFAGKNKLLRLP